SRRALMAREMLTSKEMTVTEACTKLPMRLRNKPFQKGDSDVSVREVSSSLFNYSAQSVQNRMQQFRQEFQQLGQHLQSGNLTAAQSDFAALQPTQTSSTSSSQSTNSISQEFQQLAQDLQSGNPSAAQKDYSTIQQSMQNQAAQKHHHHGGGAGSSSISQLLQQLGQALQSGSLSASQQAYSTLQQQFQMFMANGGSTATSSTSSSNSIAVSV